KSKNALLFVAGVVSVAFYLHVKTFLFPAEKAGSKPYKHLCQLLVLSLRDLVAGMRNIWPRWKK
ncbi:MAG: hypothetical protein V2A34_06060, partial [Lentisphaerota bacterium]